MCQGIKIKKMKYSNITEKWKQFINERSFDVTKAGNWVVRRLIAGSYRLIRYRVVQASHQRHSRWRFVVLGHLSCSPLQ